MKYAGIGSRETPQHILQMMKELAYHSTHTLRSGGAHGADAAFAEGAKQGKKPIELYLPWRGYNDVWFNVVMDNPTQDALDMAAKYHPNWARCTQGARKLHARNCHIILGPDLNDPVDRVFCWTPDGRGGGGTGQGIRIAQAYDIPVYDMGDPAIEASINSDLDAMIYGP